MLYPCPECSNQVSDKADTCPACGYPLKKTRKYSRRRRKLPNGFGQISEIKGRNLERPYRAMVTVDKTIYGQPISKLLTPIAYFKTYNEAYEALLEYNRIRGRHFGSITMSDLFDEWFSKEQQRLSPSRQKSIRNFWLQCENLYKIQITSLTISDVKEAIAYNPSYNYQLGVKGLVTRMLNYAVENEYLQKNILAYVNLSLDAPVPETTHHLSYTDEEMDILWQNINPTTEFILVQCYTGFRPSELLNLRLLDVNISQKTMTGGMKTEAGRDRVVPIHPKIYEIICNNFVRSARLKSEYLFSSKTTGGIYTKMSMSALQRHIKAEMSNLHLNINHSTHDGRKQFITMAKRDGVDEYAIKRIVGHRIKDITEEVYTDRSIEWLRSEIEKIK